MQQKSCSGNDTEKRKRIHLEEGGKLRIDVFTSKSCAFCGDALKVAQSAAGRLAYSSDKIEVRELSVDDRPGLVEKFNIYALPMIQVGQARVVGIPDLEDIERLVWCMTK